MPDVLKTVGRYEILREVGRGGMALVYLARQTDLDRFVALKELAAFHASDAAFAQRFLRESRVAGSLSHPNIVTVHDYFEHAGTPYIAMEYVERGSLRPFVGQMTLAQIGGVLEGLLAGLAQAEQHGIVHRDLKPENLMVTSDGRVKIADFGIAKATKQMQTGAFLTATGTTVGTPTYMAPEQAMAQDIGPWTDLYSVGCMAFEMFTGRVPFHDSDAPMAILLRHVNEEIAPVKSIDPTIDQGISDWIDQLLVKDPKERTQSANEAWDELEELMIGLLGPRWRRSARLSARTEQRDTPKPLTPAPFEGAGAEEACVRRVPELRLGPAGLRNPAGWHRRAARAGDAAADRRAGGAARARPDRRPDRPADPARARAGGGLRVRHVRRAPGSGAGGGGAGRGRCRRARRGCARSACAARGRARRRRRARGSSRSARRPPHPKSPPLRRPPSPSLPRRSRRPRSSRSSARTAAGSALRPRRRSPASRDSRPTSRRRRRVRRPKSRPRLSRARLSRPRQSRPRHRRPRLRRRRSRRLRPRPPCPSRSRPRAAGRPSCRRRSSTRRSRASRASRASGAVGRSRSRWAPGSCWPSSPASRSAAAAQVAMAAGARRAAHL